MAAAATATLLPSDNSREEEPRGEPGRGEAGGREAAHEREAKPGNCQSALAPRELIGPCHTSSSCSRPFDVLREPHVLLLHRF